VRWSPIRRPTPSRQMKGGSLTVFPGAQRPQQQQQRGARLWTSPARASPRSHDRRSSCTCHRALADARRWAGRSCCKWRARKHLADGEPDIGTKSRSLGPALLLAKSPGPDKKARAAK
jgi:hypothetical protein